MGWTYTEKPKHLSIFDFFSREFNHENEKTRSRVLACSTKNFSEAYMAYEILDKETKSKKVIAIVCLIHFNRGEFNFGYKDMEEFSGPYVFNCPKKILDLLTPLKEDGKESTGWAKTWRDRCWENIKKNKDVPKLKEGMKIRFNHPICFTNGEKIDTFYVKSVKPLRLSESKKDNCWMNYRIKRNRLKDGFQILENNP
jgi:hypothetical protein